MFGGPRTTDVGGLRKRPHLERPSNGDGDTVHADGDEGRGGQWDGDLESKWDQLWFGLFAGLCIGHAGHVDGDAGNRLGVRWLEWGVHGHRRLSGNDESGAERDGDFRPHAVHVDGDEGRGGQWDGDLESKRDQLWFGLFAGLCIGHAGDVDGNGVERFEVWWLERVMLGVGYDVSGDDESSAERDGHVQLDPDNTVQAECDENWYG